MYTPNTELLGPNEMRVTALGTGMPNVILERQKASGWYVELAVQRLRKGRNEAAG